MARLGQYFYTIRFNRFYVMIYTFVSEDGTFAKSTKVAEFRNREDARTMVWLKNGWGMPKSASKSN